MGSPVGPVGQGEAVETDEDAAIDAAYDAWDAVLGNRECHYVRWTLEQDRVRGTVVCEGPDDAGCRYYCAQGCEVYPCEHQPSLGKTCGVADWFEDGAECYYSGPEVPVHDGLIELDWTGDGYEWRYAERAESRPVVSLRAREASPRVQGEPDGPHCCPPCAVHEPGEDARNLAALSDWIDTAPANSTRDREAATWGRLAKVSEECGEVVAAFIGATNQNPRKGVTHSMEDVTKELLDVALTALCAVEHLAGNSGASMGKFSEHVRRVTARAGLGGESVG